MDHKKNLLKKVWDKKIDYYQQGFQTLDEYKKEYSYLFLRKSKIKFKSVLEFGCGNGRVVGNLLKAFKGINYASGFDISPLAIKEAKRNFPSVNFFVNDAEELVIRRKFKFVCSFYTFEHLNDPEKTLELMISATAKGGYIYIVCPNYGSPIYPSPCYKNNIITRLFKGVKRDVLLIVRKKASFLMWNKVEPIIDSGLKHVYDHDTVIEPYIFSLKNHLEENYSGIKIIDVSSGWDSVGYGKVSIKYWLFSAPFRLLDNLKVTPFKFWGPICVLLAKKVS